MTDRTRLSLYEAPGRAYGWREWIAGYTSGVLHERNQRAQPAAPAEGLDVGAMQAALVAVIESNALDSDDLLWLDKMCRKAIGTDWPYLAAPADGLCACGHVLDDHVYYCPGTPGHPDCGCRAQPVAPAEGLDEERLTAAIERVLQDSDTRIGGPYAPMTSPMISVRFDRSAYAAAIAREYDRA